VHRPNLAMMWTRFADVGPMNSGGYPRGTIADLRRIGDKIGGAVKANFDAGIKDIEGSPGGFPPHPLGFTNGCATRMSYVLNYDGVHIPQISGETVTGADKKNYIFRVRTMDSFLSRTFGKPDIAKGANSVPTDFRGKKGIIAFAVQFSDASGHITLWNGEAAVDEAYFTPETRHGAAMLGAKLWICP